MEHDLASSQTGYDTARVTRCQVTGKPRVVSSRMLHDVYNANEAWKKQGPGCGRAQTRAGLTWKSTQKRENLCNERRFIIIRGAL